jgi:uncharacterized RDD family membrane protein YckC
VETATLDRRFGALMIDWIICLIIGAAFGPLTGSPWPVVVLVVQHAVLVGLFGHTLGMALVRIRCVSVVDGTPIGIPLAALRGGLLALIVPALIMDARRRGWHDRLAGSIVLRAVKAATPED